MASALACLIETQFVPSTAAGLYAAPAGTSVQIVKLSVANTDSMASHQITLWLVPSGSSDATQFLTTPPQTILAGQVFNSPNEWAQVLAPGDSIWAQADIASKLTIRASGVLSS